MATALKNNNKTSNNTYFNLNQSFRLSKNLLSLVDHYDTGNEVWDFKLREIQNEKINFLKIKYFEEKIALLENGVGALAMDSFKSARNLVIENLVSKGHNIINLNSADLKKDSPGFLAHGINVKNAPAGQIEDLRNLYDDKTRAIYLETIAHTDLSIPDFLKIVSFARVNSIPVVVDNSSGIAGFLSSPIINGANIVIERTNSWLQGSAPFTRAVIIDGGNFDWDNGSYSNLTEFIHSDSLSNEDTNLLEPDESMNGINESFLFVNYLRTKRKINYKSSHPTQDVVALIKSLDRLPEVLKNQSGAALGIARWLARHELLEEVIYPGLVKDPNYINALLYLKNGFGNRLMFKLAGDLNFHQALIYNLQRKKVLLSSSSKKSYDIEYNVETSRIEITVYDGSFEEIIEDFQFAFNQLAGAGSN